MRGRSGSAPALGGLSLRRSRVARLAMAARSRERRMELLGALGLIGVIAGFICFPLFKTIEANQALEAERRAWTAAGPPCPIVARPSPLAVSKRRPPRTITYGGVSFTRAFGAVECSAFPEPGRFERKLYQVCRFRNPGAVTVSAPGRAPVTYEPPPLSRIVVTVRDGVPACVMGGDFAL